MGVIYYFSGTGNSKLVAKKISEKTGFSLESAKTLFDSNSPKPNDKEVGFVYPSYCWGLPKIIKDILEKIDLSQVEYLFMGVTGGGSHGTCFEQANSILKEKYKKVDYGFFVQMPGNATTVYNCFKKEKIDKLLGEVDSKCEKASNDIKSRNIYLENYNFAFKILNKLLYGNWLKSLENFDKTFIVDESKCNLCGECVKICQVKNIIIEDNKVKYLHKNCQNCLGCYNLCPQEAISVEKDKFKKKYKPPFKK